MRIAVAGGTGEAGAAVVEHARARGHEVLVLARSTGIDLAKGTGLDGALEGVDSVVDATNTAVRLRGGAVEWFERASRNLSAAAHRAGVGHLVPVSIVGIDDVPLDYYRGKVAQEAVVRSSAVDWTIVRATQFFSFPQRYLATSRAGVAVVPAMRCQPVAVESVAALIVDTLESPAPGQVLQIAGPAPTDTVTMARLISARTGGPRVWPLPIPGSAGRAIRGGALLPGAEARIDDQEFATWLTARTPTPR